METLIEVNKKEENSTIIFEFTGELDETNADKTFKTIYDDIGDFKEKDIILNLKGLKYLNSKSIGYIADVFSNVEDSDRKMYITNCNEGVKDILELVGITTIIPTLTDEKEALAELN
ncbi:STAS domain-containing protein [Candidatus Gracilibacteria bacterium 28_42_T64]|nr:STAS domain-containing protein [Candidatus Gracilibacteria bacterium 28_42_T64]